MSKQLVGVGIQTN